MSTYNNIQYVGVFLQKYYICYNAKFNNEYILYYKYIL